MKKVLTLMGLLILAGCGGNGDGELSFAVDNEPTFSENEEEEIVLRVEEGGKASTGMAVDATLTMEKMDHGIIEVHFEEDGDGTYTAETDLPMAGEWVANITAEKDGKTYQGVITFEVK